MQKHLTKSKKKGFTIIEVSLVLAIGGLIMLMVFIAWPAVQRNQRDTQRRTVDLPRLYTALTQYMTNNNGKLPEVPDRNNLRVIGKEDSAATSGNASWMTFYNNYMRAQGDTFVAPEGTAYSLSVVTCAGTNGTKTAPNTNLTARTSACNLTAAKNANNTSVTLGTAAGTLVTDAYSVQEGTIVVVVGASCDGEKAVAATTKTGGTRKFAIMYGLESGGVFCQSN